MTSNQATGELTDDRAGRPAGAEPTGDEQWDVVVVGSGPGGLTAAAALAAAGHRVLVLEAHDLAGGNTQVFRRHHTGDDGKVAEYEFDVGVHYIGDCGPGGLFPTIFAGLGIGDAVAQEGRARSIPGAQTPTFDRWAFRPLSELFAEGELSDRSAAVLDHWSGLYAGSPSQTAVAMHASIIDHYMRGAYYPEGGGQMIPARLIQVIEAHGGEVRTLTPVRRITVEDRRATGVELADGTTIAADVVISNADHARTVFDLVGEQHWDAATVRWTREAQMTLGLVCVYLVVDLDLCDGPNTNHFVFPTYATDAFYAELDSGELGESDELIGSDESDGAEGGGGDVFAYLAMASRKDPDNAHLCPAGQTNLQIMTLALRGLLWWGVETSPADGGRYRRNETYRRRKAQLTEALLDAAQRVLADELDGEALRDHVVHCETATPLSHSRYTSATGGTSYGYLHSPEQSGMHRPQHHTEIDGLWLVGANTASGHGVGGTMVGGINCAGQVLERPLLVEMMMGTTLAGPDSIPVDLPGFDPMEFSRGQRLRARRAAGRAARLTP